MIAKMKYKIVIASKEHRQFESSFDSCNICICFEGDIDEWKPKCIYNYLRAVYPFHFRFVKQFMERLGDFLK